MDALGQVFAKSLSKSAAGLRAEPSSLDRCPAVLGTAAFHHTLQKDEPEQLSS